MGADTPVPSHALPNPGSHGLPTGRFAGRDAFQHIVREALDCAALQGWKELVLCDASFEDWPLHERAVTDALRAWARSGRRFTMVARSYDSVLRDKHRFVHWRQAFGHVVDCRVNRRPDASEFPSLLWSPCWALRRLDAVHSAGVSSDDARRRVEWRELLDEILLDSTPGFPATVLGL